MKNPILFVAHSAQRGGAEYCLDTTLRHLNRSRFEPVVVFPHEGPMAESARELGVEVRVLSLCHWLCLDRTAWYWKHLALDMMPNVLRLRSLIRKHRVQLVYTNTAALFEPALAAAMTGVPHLWHVHEVLQSGAGLNPLLPVSWMTGLIRRLSALVVFESHAARSAFERGKRMDRAEVIYNSVRLADTPLPTLSETRDWLGLDANQFVVGFLGQLIDRKNPLLLIEAIRCLAGKELTCVIAGDGPLEGKVDDRIGKLGLTGRVRRLPFQADVRPFLEAVDVLVLPSREESFGLVLVEAAACGKPVIACRSQGPEEIVVDDETGVLVPQDDAVALAAAINRLAEMPKLREQMGRAGRRHVHEHFDPATNTRKLELLFERLIGGPALARRSAASGVRGDWSRA